MSFFFAEVAGFPSGCQQGGTAGRDTKNNGTQMKHSGMELNTYANLSQLLSLLSAKVSWVSTKSLKQGSALISVQNHS